MARNGKIARLPHDIREEINSRLLDGQLAPEILPWLNNLPAVIKEMELHWDGSILSPQNLSEWRLGGFKDWLKRRSKVESLKTLSNYAGELSGAGKGITSGTREIVAGHLLECMEEIALAGDGDVDPVERLVKAAGAVHKLSSSARADDKLQLEKLKAAQAQDRLDLDRDKFQRQTVEKFLAFAKTPEAQTILESPDATPIKMDKLRQLMFGDQGVKGGDGV